METCTQFGELAMDIQERLKFAQWRAGEISKAIREGRAPVPYEVQAFSKEAPLTESDLTAQLSSASVHSASVPQQAQPTAVITPQYAAACIATPQQQAYAASQPSYNPAFQQQSSYIQPLQANYGQQQYTPNPQAPQQAINQPLDMGKLSLLEAKIEACTQAEKLTRHALGSLHFQDVDTSIEKLKKALVLLQPYATQ